MSSESVASTAGSPLPGSPSPVNHRTSPITPPRLGPCFGCKQEGHWFKDYPLRRSPESTASAGDRGEHLPSPANHRTSPITPPRLGSCFGCKQEGHWLKDCPLRRSPASPASAGGRGEHPELRCHCGGVCVVRTSWTESNPGRQFYTCPIMPREDQCKLFKWCDEVIPGQHQGAYSPGKSQKHGLKSPVKRQLGNGMNSPGKPGLWSCDRADPSAPMCDCLAGRCIILKMEEGEYFGRHYFGCPIKKGQGACNFFKWRNEGVQENNDPQPEGMVEVKEPHFNLLPDEPKAEVAAAGVDQRKFVSRSEGMVPDVSIVPESPLPSSSDPHLENRPKLGNAFSPIKRLNLARICSKCGKQGYWFNEHGHCFKCDIAETVITPVDEVKVAGGQESIESDASVIPVSAFPSSIDHRLDHQLKHSGDGFSPMKRLSLGRSSAITVGARSVKCFKCGELGHWMSDCSG